MFVWLEWFRVSWRWYREDNSYNKQIVVQYYSFWNESIFMRCCWIDSCKSNIFLNICVLLPPAQIYFLPHFEVSCKKNRISFYKCRLTLVSFMSCQIVYDAFSLSNHINLIFILFNNIFSKKIYLFFKNKNKKS